MGLFDRIRDAWSQRRRRASARRCRPRRADFERMEGRELPAMFLSALEVAPAAVAGMRRGAAVELRGTFTQARVDASGAAGSAEVLPGPIEAEITVVDEERAHQPEVAVALEPLGGGRYTFRAVVRLATAARGDRNGRAYTLTLAARDAGGSDGRSLALVVGPSRRARPAAVAVSPDAGALGQHDASRAALARQKWCLVGGGWRRGKE